MTAPEVSKASLLEIGEGFVVWVVGDSVEETALLDPLPEAAETVTEPNDHLDAALLLVSNLTSLRDHLDDVLPNVGSTPVVWVCFPHEDMEPAAIAEHVDEYGYWPDEPVRLDETWSGVRLRQA